MLTLVVIALVLVFLQLGYFTVKVLRIKYLPTIANHTMSPYDWYEKAVYSVVIWLQILEYAVLINSLCRTEVDIKQVCSYLIYPLVCKRKSIEQIPQDGGQSTEHTPLRREDNRRQSLGEEGKFDIKKIQDSWKNHKTKRLVVIVLLIMYMCLALAMPILAYKRDLNYIDRAVKHQHPLTIVYEFVFKLGIFLANFFIRVFVAALYWRYVSEWDERRDGIDRIKLEMEPIKVQSNGVATGKAQPVTPDKIHDIDVQARINTYNYNLHYRRSGEETEGTRNVLQSWFVMQFLAYLLYLFIDVVSTAKPIFKGDTYKNMWDIGTHSLGILYAVLSIFLPYLLALWMVDAHRKYYAEMTKKHLLIDNVNAGVQDSLTKCYIAEVTTRKIKLCKEYDFCPKILGISIPVNSPGYAVSILLALFTVIYNITLNS